MEHLTLPVSGMTCGGCVNSVTRVLSALPGVSRVEVSLDNGRAEIDYDPARCGVAEMRQAVVAAGFEAG
ncbi:MAG: heavy-metal-associated domain-containing protein [Betaproteobacteria bacterium]|nr:heavy-metal-associated domain-containing protein [Betaproteobacteria bacterium]